MRTLLTVILLAPLGFGCTTGIEQLSIIGEQCDKNSDCQAPLICGLGRCRRECEASRDCALGLRCIKLPEGIGVCQLPEEANCSGPDDCQSPLMCTMDGCMLGCSDDDGCAVGATCETGECVEPQVSLCVYDSECVYPQVCGFRQECRFECVSQTDCQISLRADALCVQYMDPMGESSCDGPCMCRLPCTVGAGGCPPGTDCVPCGDRAGCEGADAAFCERPNPEGG